MLVRFFQFFKGADEPLVQIETGPFSEVDRESESYSLTDITVSEMTGGTALPGGISEASTAITATEAVVTLPSIPRNMLVRESILISESPTSVEVFSE